MLFICLNKKEKATGTKKRNKNIEISKLLSQLTNELFIIVFVIHNKTGKVILGHPVDIEAGRPGFSTLFRVSSALHNCESMKLMKCFNEKLFRINIPIT